ncbi:MAG: hypothetical protein DRN96_05635 [Thermoproteota archaeon]|nr:MAG: hypothetical protein DRN96_05635 [Candidatus Korarchaeota archaeon]
MRGKVSSLARYTLENPSSIREIMSVVEDYRLHPEKYPRELIYLGGGWPQDPPMEELREALCEVAESSELFRFSSRYTPTRGRGDLLELLCSYEKEVFGRSCESSELMLGCGSTDLTTALMRAVVDSEDTVVVTRPTYLNYSRQLAVAAGLSPRLVYWNCLHDGRYSPSLDELQELISERKPSMVIIISPGNPDGKVMPPEVYEGVADIAEDKGIWLMVDVAYRAFCFSEYPSYYSRGRRECEIWMCTLSKEMRAPGWRLGYIIADPELIRAVETIEQASTLAPSSIAQAALVKLLSREGIFRRIREFYSKGAERYAGVAAEACQALRKAAPEARVLEPDGGFYVFFDASRYLRSSRELCSRLLSEWQVALAPGVDFGCEGWVRLSYAPVVEEPHKLREALERMKAFFSSLGEGS